MKQMPKPLPQSLPQLAPEPNQDLASNPASPAASPFKSSHRREHSSPPEGDHHSPKRLIKPLLWCSAGIGAALLLANALKPAPVLVETATIGRGDLRVTVDAEGKTRIADHFVVAAPVSGRLQRVGLEVGDAVAAGDVVAKLDPLPLDTAIQQTLSQLQEWQAQREGVKTQRPKTATLAQANARIQAATANQQQAQAKVAQAQATLDQAIRDRDRDRELAAAGAISQKVKEASELATITRQQELDTAQMAASAAASEIEVAQASLTVLQQEQSDPDYLLRVYDAKIASSEAELARLRDDATQMIVRSPAAGQVLAIDHKSTQFLTEGSPILTLGNIRNLELVIDVLSSDAEKITTGDAILIDRGRDIDPLNARVKRIEPAAFTKISALGVEEQRVNVIGEFTNMPKAIGEAYRLDTRIVIWEGANRVKVPLSALFRCQTDWCVFRQQDHKAQRQKVQIGQRDRLMAEVQQGLQPGDVVILHPTDQVRDGGLIQAKTAH
jgi:HlyD family secretion protein